MTSYSPTIVTHLPLLLTYHCYSPTIVTHLPLLLTYHCYSPTIVTHLPLLLTYHCYSPTIVTHLPLLLTYHCYSPTIVTHLPLLCAGVQGASPPHTAPRPSLPLFLSHLHRPRTQRADLRGGAPVHDVRLTALLGEWQD